MINHEKRIAERLAKYVEVKRPADCWPWNGVLNDQGYGLLYTHRNGFRQYLRAHVVLWESLNGPVFPGLVVMHSCNNPACCNPKHLSVGTHKENNNYITQCKRRPAFNSVGKHGIPGLSFYPSRERWRTLDNQNTQLYWGRDFFEACCARKSWEALQHG